MPNGGSPDGNPSTPPADDHPQRHPHRHDAGAQQGDPEQHPAQGEREVGGDRADHQCDRLLGVEHLRRHHGAAKRSNHMLPPWVMVPTSAARKAIKP